MHTRLKWDLVALFLTMVLNLVVLEKAKIYTLDGQEVLKDQEQDFQTVIRMVYLIVLHLHCLAIDAWYAENQFWNYGDGTCQTNQERVEYNMTK